MVQQDAWCPTQSCAQGGMRHIPGSCRRRIYGLISLWVWSSSFTLTFHGSHCCLSQLTGLISWEDFAQRWAHAAGSPLAPGRCFFGKGDGVLGSSGEKQPGSMCCLFLVLELPRIQSFFPLFLCSVPLAWICYSAGSDISWVFISELLHPTAPSEWLSDRAGYQPAKHGISLPFNGIFGIKSDSFQPWLLLCKHQQNVLQKTCPKWKTRSPSAPERWSFETCQRPSGRCWEGGKGLVLANAFGLWAHS